MPLVFPSKGFNLMGFCGVLCLVWFLAMHSRLIAAVKAPAKPSQGISGVLLWLLSDI